MNIPLSISTYFDSQGGYQKLKIWSNSEKIITRAPILPYMYSKIRPMFPCIPTLVKKRLLSDPFKEIDMYKCEFNSSGDVGRYGNDEVCYENHVEFTHRLMIDEPTWVSKFNNNRPLKIISFDAEMRNDGKTFPIPSRNSIAGIGYKHVVGIENIGTGNGDGGINSDDIITIWSDKDNKDDDVIIDFFKVIEKFNPDIIVGFNSNNFDLRYIRDRCMINGINFAKYVARSIDVINPVEFLERRNIASRKKYTEVRIEGRVSYDLYYPVIRDQSMFGIKNRTMKVVAKWYKIKDIVEEDMNNVNRYLETEDGRKKIDRYLRSDINITEQLFKIYIANTMMLAEKLFMPLDQMVNATPSLTSNIIFGRELNKKNIVSNGPVIKRYESKHVHNKRGGWVETYKPGFVKKIKKLDFKSYYPFLTVQFNISPETCFIIGYEEFKGEMGYSFSWKEEINEYTKDKTLWFYISIPDSTLGNNVIVKIDMTSSGFLPIYMKDLFNERDILKKKMKEIINDIGNNDAGEYVEYAGLKSRENAIKIIINSFTGYVGNEFASYGNLACYVIITGMGRYFTQRVIEKYQEVVISSDTDAIYEDISNHGIDENEVNRFVESIVMGELGFDKCWIIMEEEGNFGAAYFMKTIGKNYYIHDLDKDIIIKHGVATKSSSKSKLIDRSSDEIVMALLKGGFSTKNNKLINAIDSAYNIDKWSVKDLQQGVHVRKEGEYKKRGTPIGLTIGKLAKERWKIPDNDLEGMQINYLKLRGNGKYTVVSDTDILSDFDYDREYYINMLDKLLEKLELKDFHPKNKGMIITVQKSIDNAWG